MVRSHHMVFLFVLTALAAASPSRSATDGFLSFGGTASFASGKPATDYWYTLAEGGATVDFESATGMSVYFTNTDGAAHNFQINWKMWIGYDDGTEHTVDHEESANYPNSYTWAAAASDSFTRYPTTVLSGSRSFTQGTYTAIAEALAKSFAGNAVGGDGKYPQFNVTLSSGGP